MSLKMMPIVFCVDFISDYVFSFLLTLFHPISEILEILLPCYIYNLLFAHPDVQQPVWRVT